MFPAHFGVNIAIQVSLMAREIVREFTRGFSMILLLNGVKLDKEVAVLYNRQRVARRFE
jgi:hypothetical protein